jgi:hypothetical protein
MPVMALAVSVIEPDVALGVSVVVSVFMAMYGPSMVSCRASTQLVSLMRVSRRGA